jgi:hypothetical protein
LTDKKKIAIVISLDRSKKDVFPVCAVSLVMPQDILPEENAAMSTASRTATVFSFCLLLVPLPFFPVYALSSAEAAWTSGRLIKRDPPITENISPALEAEDSPMTEAAFHAVLQAVPAPMPLPQARSGWMRVESGSRQAYVGIHGGTAPVSLMHSTDGVLLAFTGQTGSDFMQVLKGGNASRTLTPQPSRNSAEDAAQASPVRTAATQTAAPQAVAVQAAATQIVATQTVAVQAAAPPAAAPPAAATQTVAAQAQTEAAALADLSPVVVASAGDREPAVQAASRTEEIAAEAQPEPAKAAGSSDAAFVRQPPPANSENLVFASGARASKEAMGGYLPFGLTPSANEPPDNAGATKAATAATTVKKPVPAFKPLKLHSYLEILRAPGGV